VFSEGWQIVILEGIVLPQQLQPALGDLVTNLLRDMITAGRFLPGEHLKESELAAALKVSRGPIREALAQLEAEGHVELRRHRGAFVSTLTRTDLEEVHTLRNAIEQLAAERACTRMGEVGFAKMDAVLEKMKRLDGTVAPDEVVQWDLQFHDIIYAFCEHSRVQRVWESIRGQVGLFVRERNINFPEFALVGYQGHLQLRDALAKGDPAIARDAVDKHVSGAYEKLKGLDLPERRPES
jgi:DNA-binding GntR family transcriptional regulator